MIAPETRQGGVGGAAERTTTKQSTPARNNGMSFEEKRDTERRGRNIIIEGIREPVYGQIEDERAVWDMLTYMRCDHRIEHITKIDRIGKNNVAGRRKPRLIKVEFRVRSAAYETLEKSGRLYYSKIFANVYVKKDMSRSEREKAWNQRRCNTSGESTQRRNVTGQGPAGEATKPVVAPAVPVAHYGPIWI